MVEQKNASKNATVTQKKNATLVVQNSNTTIKSNATISNNTVAAEKPKKVEEDAPPAKQEV